MYFVVISFLACGKKSKVVSSELAELSKASNAYVRAIEENSTDCNKMAKALKKPVENLSKILAKISTELKDKKVEPTEEVTSARDRVNSVSQALIKCVSHPGVRRVFQTLQPKSLD